MNFWVVDSTATQIPVGLVNGPTIQIELHFEDHVDIDMPTADLEFLLIQEVSLAIEWHPAIDIAYNGVLNMQVSLKYRRKCKKGTNHHRI